MNCCGAAIGRGNIARAVEEAEAKHKNKAAKHKIAKWKQASGYGKTKRIATTIVIT